MGAAYGPEEVTAKVWGLVKNNSLSFTVENALFGGDPWPGVRKAFVLSYKYTGQNPQLLCATENQTVSIAPPSGMEHLQVKSDSFSTSWQQNIVNSPRRNEVSGKHITIIGAAWGKKDVTTLAETMLVNNGTTFQADANNKTWKEDGWPGVAKTLVVIYQYSEIPMTSIVKEGSVMSFVVSPPLYILGAAYGLGVMTKEVQDLVHNRQINIKPVVAFHDTWPGHNKSFVMVYQYGNDKPFLYVSDENAEVSIIYSEHGPYTVDPNPSVLDVIGAAYGLGDVTDKVASRVENNSLDIIAINATFHDTWPGNVKTLVVVYQYGSNNPLVSITQENGKAAISKQPTVYTGLLAPRALLDTDDMISLLASNYKYIMCGSSDSKLMAIANNQDKSCEFTIELKGTDFTLKDKKTSKFVVLGRKNYLYLTGTSVSTAATFTLSYSMAGGIRLATSNMYVRLAQDLSLVADSMDYFGANTAFQISLKASFSSSSMQLVDLSPCDQAWLKLIWKLTLGFFLALGLGPYIATGSANPSLLALIRSNSAAWRAVIRLKDAVISIRNATKTIPLALGTIKVLYDQDLLWSIFKFFLEAGGWWLFGAVLAKVIEVVFLPEAEAAVLLASFTTWALQLIPACFDVQKACS